MKLIRVLFVHDVAKNPVLEDLALIIRTKLTTKPLGISKYRTTGDHHTPVFEGSGWTRI